MLSKMRILRCKDMITAQDKIADIIAKYPAVKKS